MLLLLLLVVWLRLKQGCGVAATDNNSNTQQQG
jgi:hypothetical protein